MHTFLFEEGLWTVKGEYVDEAGGRAALEGETRVTHRPGTWLNEGRMRIVRDGTPVDIENRYRIVPFADGADFTSWESDHPALGRLRGHFIVVGNAILSSCATADRLYAGTEFLLQETPGRYLNRGAMFSPRGQDFLVVGDPDEKGLRALSESGAAKTVESLKKIRLSATMLEIGFKSENLGEVIHCQVELEQLVEKLRAEHGDLVTPEQCEAVRESLEGFVALIDQAFEKISGGGPGKR